MPLPPLGEAQKVRSPAAALPRGPRSFPEGPCFTFPSCSWEQMFPVKRLGCRPRGSLQLPRHCVCPVCGSPKSHWLGFVGACLRGTGIVQELLLQPLGFDLGSLTSGGDIMTQKELPRPCPGSSGQTPVPVLGRPTQTLVQMLFPEHLLCAQHCARHQR